MRLRWGGAMLVALPLPPEENRFMPAVASLLLSLINTLVTVAHTQCGLPPIGA